MSGGFANRNVFDGAIPSGDIPEHWPQAAKPSSV
jgi:hypothetical protein